MDKKFLKKIVIVFVIFLLFGTCISSSNAQMKISKPDIDYTPFLLNNEGNTLYVGGSGPNNYSNIQEAINAANEGDTIFVYEGSYSRFTANKRLTIIGENRDNTIVYANENKLSANGVVLSHFTLKGKTLNLDCVLRITGSYVVVSDCYLYPTDGEKPLYGINIEYCNHVTIKDCYIMNFDYRGILLKPAQYCNIENCVITNSHKGIETMFEETHHNFIYNCEMYNCGWDVIPASAIELSTNDNCVTNCNFYDNYRCVDIYWANRNLVTGCNFYNNYQGCCIHGYDSTRLSKFNKILGNTFYNNELGCKTSLANENTIHHNNFYDNNPDDARDEGAYNDWDDDYPSGGNYWDEYNGVDNNGDGIGDTAYEIYPNGYDNYPLMDQFNPGPLAPEKPDLDGPTSVIQWVEYTYDGSSIDPNYDCLFYLFDWGDGTNSGWVGPFGYDLDGSASHIWQNHGTFNVKAKAKDITGLESPWSDNIQVTVTQNHRPNPPVINGPSKGIAGYNYEFFISSTDADNEQIRYYISWGDGAEWTDYYSSGETVYLSHSWGKNYPASEKIPTEKTFNIQVKAQDIKGADSQYSNKYITIKNNPPAAPTMEGKNTIKTDEKYELTLSAIDPDNHNVGFEIEWGNGNKEISNSNIPSGQKTTITKSIPYYSEGVYTIKARAIDYYGAKGNWSTMDITVEKKSRTRNIILQDFISCLLDLFPLLKNMII